MAFGSKKESNAASSIMEKEMERESASKKEADVSEEPAPKEDSKPEESEPKVEDKAEGDLLEKVKSIKIESLEDLRKIQNMILDKALN